MDENKFVARLNSGLFNILVEFTPKTPKEIVQIGEIARQLSAQNEKYHPKGVVFSAVMITQNPGGRLSYEITQVVKILKENNFPEDIAIIPHVTCKDYNLDSLEIQLRALYDLGIDTILALTGDKPKRAKGVFQLDSLGLLMHIQKFNARMARQARTLDQFKKVPQFTPGAAISPFKYSEPSLIMQYIKAEKKTRCGAAFLISQAGWDVEKSRELIKKKQVLGVPIIGNALLLDYTTAYVMKDLPGCVVTPEFMEKLKGEKREDGIKRASQQVAMFKALGYNGVDIGNAENLELILQIVDGALEIEDWEKFKDNISFPPSLPEPIHLPKTPPGMEFLHNIAFEEKGPLFNLVKTILKPVENSYNKDYGRLYRLFFAIEKFAKGGLFDCRLCGDCFLPEDYFVCTRGQCDKGLPNPPCGDATVEGKCGNDPKRPCAAELILSRAIRKNDLETLRNTIIPLRDVSLEGTSSLLNHYFRRSHTLKPTLLERSGLIQIAELLHASIPSVGPAMFYLKELGEEGFKRQNRGLNVIINLITTQAECRPEYIDVNIDQLGGDTPSMMRHYVRLIKKYGLGIPVCVDSSNPEVLKAGLEEWYADGSLVKPPLINSINYAEMEKTQPILEMRKKYKFSIIGLLMGQQGVLKSSDEMYEAAKTIFREAIKNGFQPKEIFFDTVTLGITFDSPVSELGEFKPSHTYNSFNAIKKIMTDPEMKGVNTVLGVSNWSHDVRRRRIGHNRAFIEVARRYGLNSVIIDVTQEYGIKPAPKELVQLVEMFASLDGGEESVLTYNAMIREMRAKGWV